MSLTKDITLIYDESFSDFAQEENNSFVDDRILDLYEKLIVIKSISKSYGIVAKVGIFM